MVAPSLRMPIAGRSIAGAIVFTLARPMCHLVGLTDDARTAQGIGTALAISDLGGVANVLASSTARRQNKAAKVNACLDVVLASALLALGLRRQGSQRFAAIVASASVWFGAGAWLVGANRVEG